MNYIGSKFKLSNFLLESITKHIDIKLNNSIFCDLFAGSGIVGRTFKSKVKQVIANDKEYYSYVLNKNYIENHKELDSQEYFTNLNNIDGIKGKIYKNYALGGGANRQYFSDENAKKIDAIRIEIEKLKDNPNLYYYLLASLIESADKVANTASVYGAFLKHLKKSAQKSLDFIPAKFELNHNTHIVYNENANNLISKIKGDILYLDPPYNSREYGANYHLLNTIAKYDDFVPKGKTGLREYDKSAFCKKGLVEDALEDIIKKADFEYIFLSYNDEGLLSPTTIQNIFSKYGKYNVETKIYQRFKADNQRVAKQESCVEFLHILHKTKI